MSGCKEREGRGEREQEWGRGRKWVYKRVGMRGGKETERGNKSEARTRNEYI